MKGVIPIALAVLAALSLGRDAFAQAVQLPSFHFFTVSTTVSVPDRGAAYLGGVRRAASGRVGRGVPLLGKAPGIGRLGRNDAIGSSLSTGDVSVSATIIDHRELDEAVLAEARERRGDAAVRAPAPLEPAAASSPVPSASPVASVAEIRRRNQAEDRSDDAARQEEALALVAKGRQAEAEGKRSVAKIYYQMAARRADETLRQRVAQHLAALADDPRVAATSP